MMSRLLCLFRLLWPLAVTLYALSAAAKPAPPPEALEAAAEAVNTLAEPSGVLAWLGALRVVYVAWVTHIDWPSRILAVFIGVLSGATAGALFSERLIWLRRALILNALGLALLIAGVCALLASDFYATLVSGAVSGIMVWLHLRMPENFDDITLGSARWAALDELGRRHLARSPVIDRETIDPETQHVINPSDWPSRYEGIFLGYIKAGKYIARLHYPGDRHLLTIAPNRSGKGTSAIVPNLLSYEGSVLVIDPKGENAMMTAEYRGAGRNGKGLGQAVHILDPWNVTKVLGIKPARFNPIDWLLQDAENATENAMILADSLIPVRDSKESFWDDEARALLGGLLLYVAFDPAEEGQRTLGRVRDIIVADEEALAMVLANMSATPNPVARSTAARTITKDEKLRSNVLATVQSHTHFLDSPVIRDSLSASDFRFEDLKAEPTSVYLVLPADRLETFGRWLRILVQQAITVNARNIEQRAEKPILFMLDEMAALGRLAMVERAFGLMAGFGIQLWGIFQDASQAKRIYGDGWETFVGNAGVIQYFGSRDNLTAEYFSKLCGVTTVKKRSITNVFAESASFFTLLFGRDPTKPQSITHDVVQRRLAFPDELMRMRDPAQILFIEGCNPIQACKLPWYRDPSRRDLGRNLQPSYAPIPVAGGVMLVRGWKEKPGDQEAGESNQPAGA